MRFRSGLAPSLLRPAARRAPRRRLCQQDPDLTYGKLRTAIRDHVTANQALAGRTVTGGQLDAAAALAAVD